MIGHSPSTSLGGRVFAASVVTLAILAVAPVNVGAQAAEPTRERRAQDGLRFVYFRDDQTTTASGSDGDMARARRQTG